tara:strand:- start:218 stop:721 length:504 start_codon:yes stop_codon:yes gene_type:complete
MKKFIILVTFMCMFCCDQETKANFIDVNITPKNFREKIFLKRNHNNNSDYICVDAKFTELMPNNYNVYIDIYLNFIPDGSSSDESIKHRIKNSIIPDDSEVILGDGSKYWLEFRKDTRNFSRFTQIKCSQEKLENSTLSFSFKDYDNNRMNDFLTIKIDLKNITIIR